VQSPVVALAATNRSHRLATAHQDGRISVWNTEALFVRDHAPGAPLLLQGTSTQPLSVAWSANGSLAVGYQTGEIFVWDPDLVHHNSPLEIPWEPRALAFTQDGSHLLIRTTSNAIHIIDTTGTNNSDTLAGLTMNAHAFAIGGNGLVLLSEDDGRLSSWDPTGRRPSRSTQTGDPTAAHGLDVSPDGRYLASTGGDKTIKVTDLASFTIVERLKSGFQSETQETAGLVAFSPTGALLSSIGGEDGKIYVWQKINLGFEEFITIGKVSGGPSSDHQGVAPQNQAGLVWLTDDAMAVLSSYGEVETIRINAAAWEQRLLQLDIRRGTTIRVNPDEGTADMQPIGLVVQ
jgi:WD40 repeat protein